MTFGPQIPDNITLRVMSDSLTSVDVLADAAAHNELMQWLHQQLLELPDFRRLAARALIGHTSDTGLCRRI